MSREPRTAPLSSKVMGSSAKPGWGAGASTISGWVLTFFSPFLPPHPQLPFFLLATGSCRMFIIPQTTRINTTMWSKRPVVDGHPVGVAMRAPKTERINRNVSGLATTKKVRPEMMEVISFSSCLRPLQPQPQSLKMPIVIYK